MRDFERVCVCVCLCDRGHHDLPACWRRVTPSIRRVLSESAHLASRSPLIAGSTTAPCLSVSSRSVAHFAPGVGLLPFEPVAFSSSSFSHKPRQHRPATFRRTSQPHWPSSSCQAYRGHLPRRNRPPYSVDTNIQKQTKQTKQTSKLRETGLACLAPNVMPRGGGSRLESGRPDWHSVQCENLLAPSADPVVIRFCTHVVVNMWSDLSTRTQEAIGTQNRLQRLINSEIATG
ncbi:unnamed protein product [Protopolystoma xenopodis]|uniref:Uncharacterized protein n=1 Tax=Protopolystoma xenopodis TaxID=117903 RepID=A0A448WPL4_9PLAT|nr:unnamed protein product [Protopolystoma xenopodis]